MKVAAFTPGPRVPSARFRVRQFIPMLEELGITLKELVTRTSAYPPPQAWRRPLWGGLRLGELSALTMRSRRYDAVLLQREMVSSLVTFEPLTGRPRILDVDDAIHLLRDGRAARRLAEISDRVVAGNAYLAEWYGRWNSDVVILPTAVDTDKYRPRKQAPEPEDRLVIGWIGTSANYGYLRQIEPALERVLEANPAARLKVVSDRPPGFSRLDPRRCTFVAWSEGDEEAEIGTMHIGIMPLEDSDWARGKCSFKMLQYMSCAIPVVVSPVGMNAEVLRDGAVGLAARGEGEWVEALVTLLADAGLRCAMGKAGREVVEQSYSVRVVAPKLAEALR
jgi:glycosyltransferase involved in cell wall biosynthesis